MNKGVKGTEGGVKRGIVNFEMIKWGIFREGAVRELLRGDNSTTLLKICFRPPSTDPTCKSVDCMASAISTSDVNVRHS